MNTLSNIRLKDLVKLQQQKYRKETGLMLVEGFRLIEQICENSIPLKEVFCLEKDAVKISRITDAPLVLAEDWQLQKLADTKNPQNIVALLETPQPKISSRDFLLYLDNISEPGNLGAIFRSASAFSVDGIILSPGCCDVYNPKVIRASLGAVFSVPSEVRPYQWLIEQESRIIGLSLPGKTPLPELTEITKPLVLVIGSEAEGIDNAILQRVDELVFIPISEKMESLNAASATAIALYHFTTHFKQ